MKSWLRYLVPLPLAAPLLAVAHTGHGMDLMAHWHASDTWGLIVVAALTALVWKFIRRK